MRSALVIAVALALCPSMARAQSPAPTAPTAFEGITLGEPLIGLKQRMGDPIWVANAGGSIIWRYLGSGGGYVVDVLVKNNAAISVTVLQRSSDVRYVDSNGIAFGTSPDQVKAKLGAPWRENINADDKSLDLWFRIGNYAWIYEFHADALDFIQLVASPDVARTFAAGPDTAPDDGTTLDRAIWIRPSSPLFNTTWIAEYLLRSTCGNGGHWKQMSSHFEADAAKNDPSPFTIVHARCTEGTAERDFYFDTHGAN